VAVGSVVDRDGVAGEGRWWAGLEKVAEGLDRVIVLALSWLLSLGAVLVGAQGREKMSAAGVD
jgi:hypothetical protein